MYNNGNTSKNVTGASVVDGTIANADIDGSAAIAQSKQATLVITDSEVADNELSGNKIDGGTISNFASTGIDDNATSTAITIDSSNRILAGSEQESLGGGSNLAISSSGSAGLRVKRADSYGACTQFYNYGGSTVGSISVDASSTAYNTSSDYRLKENVAPMTGAIDRLNQLKPSRFNFIADPTTVVDGFLAHEAQTVVPESVTGEKDGEEMQGIDQSKLVPLLVGALQEAITRIEQLENN